jgi:hypothetical protein
MFGFVTKISVDKTLFLVRHTQRLEKKIKYFMPDPSTAVSVEYFLNYLTEMAISSFEWTA